MPGGSRRDRVRRRELIAGTTAGLIASSLPSVLSGCTYRSRHDETAVAGDDDHGADSGADASVGGQGGDGQTMLDSGSAGAGGAGGSGPDATVDAGPPSCADLWQRYRVVDFQVVHAILTRNINGIALPPRYTGRPQPELPWLTEPPCQCYEASTLGEYVLGDGETSLALLGSPPYRLPDAPGDPTFAWNNDELLEHVALINGLYPGRVLAQAAVMPNDRIELQLEMMTRLAPHVAAWTVFTEWSPTAGGDGFFLDEGVGPAMIAKAIELGVPIISVNKGKALWPGSPIELSSPRDIGPAASMFSEARIVVCNAAFEHGLDSEQTSAPDPERPDADLGWGRGVGEWPEGPYEEQDESVLQKYPLTRGVNSLIKSLRDSNIGPNGTRLDETFGPLTNVYVTPGTGWPRLISRPEEAMHFWGKLLKHVGEDRVLWGTVSPEFGPSRVIIEEFRKFEISEELQAVYGYPALTQARKEKILRGNALRLLAETGQTIARCDAN